jgi:hypothetical protein
MYEQAKRIAFFKDPESYAGSSVATSKGLPSQSGLSGARWSMSHNKGQVGAL